MKFTNIAKKSRKKYIIASFFIWCIVLLLMYNFSALRFLNSFQTNEHTKYILYYTTMFGNEAFNLGLGSQIFKNCSYNNCFATHNKSLMPLDKFDALLFHGIEVRASDIVKLSQRSPNQIYVYSNQESPLNTPYYIKFPPNFFNWTMTYRMDSDILRTYGYVVRQPTRYNLPSSDEIDKKEKRIAWFVSNCITYSKREVIANEISKYYPVDIYGSCGNLTCAKSTQEECYSLLETDYRYYFSAENSLCEDYLTEKAYNILQRNVVPLVYGHVRYRTVTPPNSVIDISDFYTVEELVSYLKFLDANPAEYLRYFEWKKRFVIDTTSNVTLCSLCEKLHKPLEHKWYKDISSWWFGDEFPLCKTDLELPTIVKNIKNQTLKYLTKYMEGFT